MMRWRGHGPRRADHGPVEVPLFSLADIFGVTLGLLVIIAVILVAAWGVKSSASASPEPAKTRSTNAFHDTEDIEMASTHGYIVELHPAGLYIGANRTTVDLEDLEREANAFQSFVEKEVVGNRRAAVFFLVFPGANDAFLSARATLIRHGITRFRAVIINSEKVDQLLAKEADE